ncbi:M81 family metallopeptidase [Hoeflea sp.]|uniref:M81 family metallopeptidase n=1 Tax=Hoeflea sp. TaxID=1940281 RepID=UPI003A8FCC61
MRVAVASFEYEGNTFSLTRADRDDFARRVLAFGADVLSTVEGRSLALTGGCEVLRQAGVDLVPIVVAIGGSGGAVRDTFFREIRAAIECGLRDAGALDGVFFALHGAMICETIDDPEGNILALARSVVGSGVPIAASLDLHANVTPLMAESADILVGYETYPHNDVETTGRRAADMLVRTLRREIAPVMRIRRIDSFVPVIGGATEEGHPMGEVRAEARQMEKEGRALSVSYFPVQPWLDLPDIGICGLAVTDGDPDGASEMATDIVQAMWTRRHDYYLPHLTAREAIAEARTLQGPVALLDAADCVGGGSSGDQAEVLAALLEKASDLPCTVLIVDPAVAAAAQAAGPGARLTITLGASCDARFCDPVHLDVEVSRLSDGRFSYDGGPMAGPSGDMGASALVRHKGLHIVVASYPTYDYSDEQFRALGIDWRDMRIVVFKNPMNFRNAIGPETPWIGVDSRGATAPRLERLEWTSKKRPFWPLDDASTPPFM